MNFSTSYFFTIPCDQTEATRPETNNGWSDQDKDSRYICNGVVSAPLSNIELLVLPSQLPSESKENDKDMQNEYDEDDMGAAIEAMRNTGLGGDKNVCNTETMGEEEYEWKDEIEVDREVMREKNVRSVFVPIDVNLKMYHLIFVLCWNRRKEQSKRRVSQR